MDYFKKGYKFFEKNLSYTLGTNKANVNNINYINSIEKEIEKLTNDVNSFSSHKTSVSQLKGNVAEFWHSGTHNIDAAAKRIQDRTVVNESTDFASPDITGNDGIHYGLKYYASGGKSAKVQSESIFQRYEEYQAKTPVNKSLEEYLAERGYDDAKVINDPLYQGQVRIIPKDQMVAAISWLEKKICKESIIRPEQVKRHEETLSLLRDRISASNGSESIPLTKEQAEQLARLGKAGEFDPSNYGLTTKELVETRYILEQSFKAGLTAGAIAMVLKTAPEIYKAIHVLVKNGVLEEGQFKKIGFMALKGASFSFICGTVSASITAACKGGFLGESFKSVSPTVVGAVTVLTINVMKDAFFVATGKITKGELIDSLVRGVYISTCSLILGGVTQGVINIPFFGYLLGGFVGSVVGDFTYRVSHNTYISFCIESGFTMFGVVEQNYQLPNEILKEIGIKTFEDEKLLFKEFQFKEFRLMEFQYKKFMYETIGIKIIRRGVIGVNRIGYV